MSRIDHGRAIDLVLHQGKPGEIYNVGGHNEKTNNQIVDLIVENLGLSKDRIKYVKDRSMKELLLERNQLMLLKQLQSCWA